MLKVKELSVEYSPDKTLNEISFTVENSSVVVVLGQNQSGKSLLLSSIANCDLPHGGQITVNHFKAETEPEKAKLLMSFCPELPDIPEQLNGYEYLELVANFYSIDTAERISSINNLADILNIKVQLHITLEYLSPAEKKKISLIAAFLADRPVILLDEPVLFQDHFSRKAILSIIENRKTSASILIATNDLNFAQSVGDKFIFLKSGEITASGTLEELAHQSQSKKSIVQIFEQILG